MTKQKTKQLLLVLLLIVGSIDLGINSGLLANSLCMNDTSYRKNQEKIIRIYRMMINQTIESHRHLTESCMKVI